MSFIEYSSSVLRTFTGFFDAVLARDLWRFLLAPLGPDVTNCCELKIERVRISWKNEGSSAPRPVAGPKNREARTRSFAAHATGIQNPHRASAAPAVTADVFLMNSLLIYYS
jgi:hypothetical protein